MPKITKVVYGKTFNIGNYEAEHVRLEAELTGEEYSETVLNYTFQTLKQKVHELQRDG